VAEYLDTLVPAPTWQADQVIEGFEIQSNLYALCMYFVLNVPFVCLVSCVTSPSLACCMIASRGWRYRRDKQLERTEGVLKRLVGKGTVAYREAYPLHEHAFHEMLNPTAVRAFVALPSNGSVPWQHGQVFFKNVGHFSLYSHMPQEDKASDIPDLLAVTLPHCQALPPTFSEKDPSSPAISIGEEQPLFQPYKCNRPARRAMGEDCARAKYAVQTTSGCHARDHRWSPSMVIRGCRY
jgi:hypothetical protein